MTAMGAWTDDLTDKVCVVTGGAGGIGRAFAARGAGDGVLVVTNAVRSLDDTLRLRDATLDRFGGVHVVCLNAGAAPVGPLLDTPPDVWEWGFDVNVRVGVRGALVFAPLLAEQGACHVVCTASIAGLADTPTLPPYGVSKHAVVGL